MYTTKEHHPIPDFPPYDVRQPHIHGAPTTDDTSHGDFDIKTGDKKDNDEGRVREELPSASSWRTSHACRGGRIGALTKQK